MHAPLNIKTCNSLLKSMIKIEDLVKIASKNNIEALTITDDNMYGVLDFYKACQKYNIKPIIGLEVSLPEIVILYAQNYEGYKNLMKLTTIKSEKNLTIDDLSEYSSNIICLVPYESRKLYNELKKLYKYIFITYKDEQQKSKIKASNILYMNEILCINKEDEKYLKYLKAIKEGIKVNEVKENFINVSLLPLPNQDKNNELLVSLCDVKIKTHQDLLPVFNINKDAYTELKKACIEGMKKIFGNEAPKKYAIRLKHELEIINKMGFCDYFLIVSDYIKYAKNKGILVGPGRGSAAGSLVAYTLNITTIDPLKYNLLFERFLNPERITMPDIDVDFEDTRREEVIEYCMQKYGLKKVALIVTFGTLAAKQAIKDVCRTINIEQDRVDHLSKLLDSRLTLKQNYQNPKVKRFLEINPEFKPIYKIASRFEGLKRHTSLHAAGIVMSKYNLDDYIPLDKTHDEFYATEYDKDHLEELGLFKMDFLGLKNLTLITNILKEIENLEFDTIPEDDPKALNIFNQVNTIGIFQFESEGMKKFLQKFKPTTFEDIVSALALFRPGPMKNIDSYIRRKRGLEKIDYFHKDLEPILKPTYGIIVYQEQIMQIANIMAGYTLAEADLLRRAMSKKSESILLKEKDKFISGSIKRGYDESLAHKVYDMIFRFADYGFNRSHSVAYAMISYRMAYLKAHYPKIFMKHLLSSAINSEIKTKEYIYECTKNGMSIHKPDINLSKDSYEIINNQIIFPLTNIKNVGINATKTILEERNKGKFKDIFDFVCRCYGGAINTKTLENLIYAGTFDSFGFNKKTLIQNLELITNYSEIGAYVSDDTFKPELELYQEFNKKELMQKELEVFGFYLSNHPVTEYKKQNPKAIELKNISNYFDKIVEAIIYVDKTKEIDTKSKEKMMFITASDELSSTDIVIFPRTYKISPEIEIGDILKITGKVEKRYDEYQIIANKIYKLN